MRITEHLQKKHLIFFGSCLEISIFLTSLQNPNLKLMSSFPNNHYWAYTCLIPMSLKFFVCHILSFVLIEFLSCTFLVFDSCNSLRCHNLFFSFVIIWVAKFCKRMILLVLSQFDFLSLVTIWSFQPLFSTIIFFYYSFLLLF